MSINRIALYHLETLICIERLGTFAAAAEQLNTTQPAVSARMAELEDRLGAKLFQRNGRLMTLTPAGRELVRDYIPIWVQLQGALMRSGGLDHLSGIVRIGAGEIAAATYLPNFVMGMKRNRRNLSFEIEIQLTAQMIQDLLAGKIDLAFAAGHIAHPALVATPIGPTELIWAASPCVAEAMRNAESNAVFSLWSLPSHSPIHHVTRKALPGLLARPPLISLCNNVRTMIDIVAQGDGFALLPKSMIKREMEELSLVEVFIDKPVAPIIFHVAARVGESDPVILEVLREAYTITG